MCLVLAALPQARGGILHHQRHPLVVAYFAQRGLDGGSPYYLRDIADSGGASFLDQINYSRASITGGRCSVADPEVDLETTYTDEHSVNRTSDNPASPFRGYFHQLKELKQRYPKLKVLISLEGTAVDFREDAKPEHLREFVASCVDIFLRGHFASGVTEPGIFDGIDVNWEFPQREDANNFQALIEEFRRQMNAFRHGLTLAVAVGDQPQMQAGTDFRKIAPLVDEIGVMNYNYTGPWEPTTGFLAPLFSTADASRGLGSVADSIAAYEKSGIPRRKLLMGIPFYGYEWRGVAPANNGLFQPGNAVSKDKPYREIRQLQPAYSLFRDPGSRAPWLFNGTSFWTFEDPISVEYKVKYAAQKHLGGIMIWELGEDTAEATLLTAAWRSLHPQSAMPISESEETASDASQSTGAEAIQTP
jgi:chitinase